MDRVIHATDKKSRMFHFSISLPLDARRIYSDEIYDPVGAKRFNAADLCSFFCYEEVQRGIKWNIYQMRPDLVSLWYN